MSSGTDSELSNELTEAADSSLMLKLATAAEKEHLKHRYEQLCRVVNIDEKTMTAGWELISQLSPEDNVISRILFDSFVFCFIVPNKLVKYCCI